jgi:integrase
MYADGGGLYLQVTNADARSWIFRYAVDGRERYMGLGPAHTISLADAREKALECRKLRLAGVDPIEHRETQRLQVRVNAAKAMTFSQCVDAYLESHEPSWRNPKHRQQWRNTLKDYACPVLGELPVAAIDTGLIEKVLRPLWMKIPETASRLRGRIESVLDWATVSNYRTGDNQARWRGHLEKLLPAPSKVRLVKHHAALPYTEINALVTALRAQKGIAAKAVLFTIFTAARTGEALGARWSEIDRTTGVWAIPGERMKGGREHRVPLSSEALEIVDEMRDNGSDYVFPGARGASLSDMAMLKLLRRMGRSDLTVHGFRSTFRDWAAELTSYPNHVVEMALAHVIGDKVEAAYRRGDLFEKRRRLMAEWGRYCASPAGKAEVVPIGAARHA